MLQQPPYKRGQASVDFLMTYGWAFLLITAAVGVIYASGLFNFSSMLPQSCDMFGQVECFNFQVGGDELKLELRNRLSDGNVVIENVTLLRPGNVEVCHTGQIRQDWGSGQIYIATLNNCAFDTNRFDGTLQVAFFRNYTWCVDSSGILQPDCAFFATGRIKVNI